MSFALVAALAAAPTALPNCSWDRPGHNAFVGDVVAAVDRYQDIPAATRAKLKARMAARQYDEIVSIRRDSIQGQARYGSEIRDMHFGAGQTCGTVSRAAWAPDLQERGLVYCEDGQCILVPTVCRNVSRITRSGPADGPAQAGAGPTGGGGGGGGGSGEGPGTAAAALPAAGLGGMPASQNAPDSFARSAGIGKAAEGAAGAAAGGLALGGAGDAGAGGGAMAGGTGAGGSGALGAQGADNTASAVPSGPPPLWASVGAGALLAGLPGGNNSGSGGTVGTGGTVGSGSGNSDSFASGSGPAGNGAASSGSAAAGGVPGGNSGSTGTGVGKALDGAPTVDTVTAGDPLSGALSPFPAPPAVFLPGRDSTAAIPEAHSGWMMALGAALLLVWRRPWVRPRVGSLVKRVS